MQLAQQEDLKGKEWAIITSSPNQKSVSLPVIKWHNIP